MIAVDFRTGWMGGGPFRRRRSTRAVPDKVAASFGERPEIFEAWVLGMGGRDLERSGERFLREYGLEMREHGRLGGAGRHIRGAGGQAFERAGRDFEWVVRGRIEP